MFSTEFSSAVPAIVVRPCALTEEPAGAPLEMDQGDVIKVCFADTYLEFECSMYAVATEFSPGRFCISVGHREVLGSP